MVGTVQYLSILTLGAYGLGPDQGLATGIVLHLVLVLPLLALALPAWAYAAKPQP
jgi:hypothetical protein